jgi:hypothetical protein
MIYNFFLKSEITDTHMHQISTHVVTSMQAYVYSQAVGLDATVPVR